MIKKLFWIIIIIAILMVINLFFKTSAPNTADTRSNNCSEGFVATHPNSSKAIELIEQTLTNDNGSGISIAVMIDGELIFAHATGELDKKYSLAPNAGLRTGSVAKLFTATAAARLIEMGILDLNEPINGLIPEIENKQITLYHLGTHTSGIRHMNFNNLSEANNRISYASLTDALDLFITEPLTFEPGEDFLYTSLGYNLIGVLIERAYNKSYEEALNELISEPLEISSLIIDDVYEEIDCRSTFNTIAFSKFKMKAPWRDNSDLYPSGGLLLSAPELAVFVDAIFNSNFHQPETIKLFTTPTKTPKGELTGYGFAWQINLAEDGSIEWYGHGGQTNGAYASVRYYPANKMTIVGMTNYNYWLTSTRPEFFNTVREELPIIFSNP